MAAAFRAVCLARGVLADPVMNAQWKKLGSPAVFGFLFGLVVTAAVAYALPAVGAGTAEVVNQR
jgi:hypothetical protein